MDLDLLTVVVVVPDESSSYVSHEQNDTTETKLTAAASTTRYCSIEPEVAAVPRDIHMDTAQVAPSAGTTYPYYYIPSSFYCCTYVPSAPLERPVKSRNGGQKVGQNKKYPRKFC